MTSVDCHSPAGRCGSCSRSSRKVHLLVHVARTPAWVLVFAAAGCLDPTRPRSGVPTLDDPGGDNYFALSAGREHTCALAADSTAHCWGSNEFAQLGAADDGTTCARDERDIPCQPRPVAVAGGMKFRRIAAGGAHTCAIALDDRVWCWGDNLRGSLGDPSPRRSEAPIPARTTARFADVVAGGEHTCALRLDGVAMCWGANEHGQVGTGSSAASVAVPTAVSGPLAFASLSAAGARTCARLADGVAYCWGRTWVTRFGSEDVIRQQLVPARVQSPLLFRFLSGGVVTTCGVTLDGDAYCWEANSTGTIGDGSVSGSLTPRPVAGPVRFLTLGSAERHSCGLAVGGAVYCWGTGLLGELGVPPVLLGSTCGPARDPCSTTPVRASGYRAFTQLSVGQGGHSCALTRPGNVYCWGAGGMGQRGDGGRSPGEWSPVKIAAPRSSGPL